MARVVHRDCKARCNILVVNNKMLNEADIQYSCSHHAGKIRD